MTRSRPLGCAASPRARSRSGGSLCFRRVTPWARALASRALGRAREPDVTRDESRDADGHLAGTGAPCRGRCARVWPPGSGEPRHHKARLRRARQHMTAPSMPEAAGTIFGRAAPKAAQHACLLAGPGVDRGLIGPNEIPRLWERHLLNCAVVASLVPTPCSLLDLGSGAGLPGIVLALLLPDAEVTLLEPMAKRAAFLEECVTELGLGNVGVSRARAEELAGTLMVDVVTARAVAPLDRLAAMAVRLLRPGGIVLAIKGAKAAQEVAAARDALSRLAVQQVEVLRAGSGKVDPAATVVRLTAGQ